jgi:hypothetical protein
LQLKTRAYPVTRKDEWQQNKTLTYSLRIVIPKQILKALPPGTSSTFAFFWRDHKQQPLYDGFDFGLQRVEDARNAGALSHYFLVPLRSYGGSLGFSVAMNQYMTQTLGVKAGTEFFVDVMKPLKHRHEALSDWAIVFKVAEE